MLHIIWRLYPFEQAKHRFLKTLLIGSLMKISVAVLNTVFQDLGCDQYLSTFLIAEYLLQNSNYILGTQVRVVDDLHQG